MWATIAACPSSSGPWTPPTTIGSARSKPPHKTHSVTVSAKYQRRHRRQNNNTNDYDYDGDEDSGQDNIRGLGQAVVTAVKSNPSIKASNSIIHNPKEEEGEREFSGSDILRALQRATAKKHKNKNKNKKKSKPPSFKNTILDAEGDNSCGGNSKNVRTLCVKSEWSTRLDQLELRLQELLNI